MFRWPIFCSALVACLFVYEHLRHFRSDGIVCPSLSTVPICISMEQVLADSNLTSAVMFGIGGLLVGEAVLGSLL